MAANASTIALQTYEAIQARATVIPHDFVFSSTSCCAGKHYVAPHASFGLLTLYNDPCICSGSVCMGGL